MIKDLYDGFEIRDQKFLVSFASKGVSNGGQAYLNLVLQDFSGQVDAKVWSINDDDIPLYSVGNIIMIDGDVIKYKEKLQVKINSASLVDQDFEDLSMYVQSSDFTLGELKEKFNKLLATISDKEYLSMINDIFGKYGEAIFEYPAAVRNHHTYTRGLITHSISVAEICEFLSAHYGSLNHDLLITAALLHDIGKIVEFSSPLLPKYTEEGKLIGHITIGYSIIDETAKRLKISEEKRILLEHAILSHHGHLEFGSPVLPMTREAITLSMVDDLDAKQSVIDSALDEIVPGEFTNRIFALDDRALYKPKK